MKRQNHISSPKGASSTERWKALSKGELKSIRSLLRRKERERSGRYLIEGGRLCSEALLWSQGLEKVVIAAPIRSKLVRSIVDICGEKGVPLREADEGTLKALCDTVTPQGVVAVVRPTAEGYEVEEIDHDPGTFVHEIEIGDLDGDGVPEIYATPSLPNKLDGTPQPGSVVRYVPARGEGRTVVAVGLIHFA